MRITTVADNVRTVATGLRTRRWSAAEVVDACLDRAEAAQGTVGAFADIHRDRARAEARAADRRLREGRPYSILEGIPYAVKDVVAVAGSTMHAGSKAYAQPSAADAAIVTTLGRAGGVLLGRTRMHEIAFGTTGINAFDGGARNPRDPARIPGGSSSGSAAAVAAGICCLALGTDTGGSCRIPAACCGIVGYKPTYGMLDLGGVMPLAATLDHLGFLATSVDDVWVAVATCIGGDPSPPVPVPPWRAGVLTASQAGQDEVVGAAFADALDAVRRAGWELVEVELVDFDRVAEVTARIMFYEAYRVHEERVRSARDSFGPDVLARLTQGAAVSREDYEAALAERKQLRLLAAELFHRVDVLLSPTVPIVPPKVEEAPAVAHLLPRNTRVFNLTGLPAVTIPLRPAPFPVGLQIIGREGRDRDLLATAHGIELLVS